MEATLNNNSFSSEPSLKEVMASFFKERTPDSAKFLFWKVFQCWALQDCTIKAEVSDEEVALFFDQLTDLVAAAYIEHQADRASDNPLIKNDHGS
jgi:hypothetical protein